MRSARRRRSDRDNHVDFQPNELRGKLVQPIVITATEAPLILNVLAFDIPERAHAFKEGRNLHGFFASAGAKEADARKLALRTREVGQQRSGAECDNESAATALLLDHASLWSTASLRRIYCGLMPASFTTLPQMSYSRLMYAANSSGVLDFGSVPVL